jgi:ubiquinone/menaquinone biosynthesis C-methylase UbiE
MPPKSTVNTGNQQYRVNSYFEQVSSYWAEIYDRVGIKEFIHQERLRIVLDLVARIGLPSNARVLDVGSGAGLAAVALAKRGHVIEAVDTVQNMVDATRDRATKEGVEHLVRSSVDDINSLSFPDATFSLVIAIGVLPWLSSIENPLREMYRVLHAEGYLIITVDNRWCLSRFLDPVSNPLLAPIRGFAKRVLRWPARGKPCARARVTSTRECDSLLQGAGLEKIQGITLGFGPFSLFGRELLPYRLGLKAHQTCQDLANRGVAVFRSGGSQYLVLARKSGASPALN